MTMNFKKTFLANMARAATGTGQKRWSVTSVLRWETAQAAEGRYCLCTDLSVWGEGDLQRRSAEKKKKGGKRALCHGVKKKKRKATLAGPATRKEKGNWERSEERRYTRKAFQRQKENHFFEMLGKRGREECPAQR